jgi:hypothetical protein
MVRKFRWGLRCDHFLGMRGMWSLSHWPTTSQGVNMVDGVSRCCVSRSRYRVQKIAQAAPPSELCYRSNPEGSVEYLAVCIVVL